MIDRHEVARRIVQDVAELSDRTSPEDRPDLMLVTADELRDIVLLVLPVISPPEPTEGLLSDPNAVHLNMLRGTIAKPSFEQIKHIYAGEFAALSPPEPTEGLLERIADAIDEARYKHPEHPREREYATRLAWAALRAMPLQDHAKRLREVLTPFVEIARRLGWDKIEDDDMALGEHVIEAPADDIAPGAVYCLMIGAFREAARAMVAEQETKP